MILRISTLMRLAVGCWLLFALSGCAGPGHSGDTLSLFSPSPRFEIIDPCLERPVETYLRNPARCKGPSPITTANVNQPINGLCPLDLVLGTQLAVVEEVLAKGANPFECSDQAHTFYAVLTSLCRRGGLEEATLAVLARPAYLQRLNMRLLAIWSVGQSCSAGVKLALEHGAAAADRIMGWPPYPAQSPNDTPWTNADLDKDQTLLYVATRKYLALAGSEESLHVVEALVAAGARADEPTRELLARGATSLDEKALGSLRRALKLID